jgi:putative intracellular protease/amidase
MKKIAVLISILFTFNSYGDLMPWKSHYKRRDFNLEGKRALIITTSQRTLDKPGQDRKGKKSGVWAPEMTEPYYEFLWSKMEVDIASIKGGEIPIDPFSLWPLVRTSYDRRYKKDPVFKELVKNSLRIDYIDFTTYDIIFIAGGWGAAYDLAQSEILAEKISEAYESGVVLAAVCHGPLGFTRAVKPDGSPLVEGVRMTGVPNRQLKQLGIFYTPLHPQEELEKYGAIYEYQKRVITLFANKVVVDEKHQIVTGQNQRGGVETAQKAMELLERRK